MEQTVSAQPIPHIPEGEKESFHITFPTFIIVAILLMLIAIIYVGSHIHMTELEYKIAAELGAHEQLSEEQKKLKMEYAMLKAPNRLESIATGQLQMSYPERDQVISLKKSGE
jgi:cell division protein FtsL